MNSEFFAGWKMSDFYRCSYCGSEFEWERKSFLNTPPFCSVCGDDKISRLHKDVSKKNVFGYDETAPKPDAYIRIKK